MMMSNSSPQVEGKKCGKKAKDLRTQPKEQEWRPKDHDSDIIQGEEKSAGNSHRGDIERNNTKSDRKTKKRRSKAENLQIDNEVHDTIYSERKETTGSLKVELIFKEKSKPYPEVSSIYETKKIKEKPDLDHLETGTQGDQPLPLDRVNAADCSMEKEVGKEKRRKRRKPSENISLIHEKESSGFEKYKMKDSAETIESRGEKITGISSKIGSLIQKKTESERENDANASKEKEKSREHQKKCRKPTENIPLINEKKSSQLERNGKIDSEEAIETIGESLMQKKTKVEREIDVDLSMQKKKSEKRQQIRRKPTDNVSLENETESGGLKKPETNESEESIEARGEKGTGICQQIGSLMLQKTEVERENDVGSIVEKEENRDRRKKGRKPAINRVLVNEKESSVLENHEMKDSEEAIKCKGEKNTEICFKKTEVERENDADSTMEKGKSRERRQKGRKPAENIVLVNEKESNGLEKHEMNDTEDAVESKGEKHTGICSKKTKVGRENEAGLIMEKEKSRERRQKGRKPAEHIVLVNEESSRLEKHEMNDSEEAVESKGEKNTGILSKKTEVERENDAGSTMEKEKSRERRQKGRKPAINRVLVNGKESSGLEKHEMNDSEEALESTGEKNTGILSKKTEVEREKDAGSPVEKEKSRERRQKGRKPAENIVLVNEKESSGLEKHEMNDSGEAVESKGEKNTGILSKKTEVERENDAGSTVEKEKSRERRQKERKPAENILLVNEKVSSGLEKHEMNDSEEAVESKGEKNTGILSKKTEVERENDAGSTMEKEKSRERRQKERKPAENIVLVNEKESRGLDKHEMDDSEEGIKTRGEKNAAICSTNKSLIQEKIDHSKKKMVSFPAESEEILLPRISVLTEKKKLLVLDLNGLLVDVVPGSTGTYRAPIKVGQKSVFKRPFCDEFIDFCFGKFDVGIWSSRTWKNLDQMVDFLFGEKRRILLFCWDQAKCTPTGFKTRDNRQKPLVLKELSRLWSSSGAPWQPGHFSPSNTLLIDDSPYKALCNPPNTAIFPKPYSYLDLDDISLGPEGDLRLYLEKLAAAEDVQDYVSKQPFGQLPILPDCPHWAYYSMIIQKMNSRFWSFSTRYSSH